MGPGEIGHKTAVEPLIRAVTDGDRYVREGAVAALGKIKDPRVVQPLILALQDHDESMRRAAEEALGSLGRIALPALVTLLGAETGMSDGGSPILWAGRRIAPSSMRCAAH